MWVYVSDQNMFSGWVDLFSWDFQGQYECMLCDLISCGLCVVAYWGFNSDNGAR